MRKTNIAIVGATGLVGRTMIKVLEEFDLSMENLKLLASESSAGTTVDFQDKSIEVEALNENSFKDVDVALFSAGKYVSEKYAAIAVRSNCTVIDNGSHWRLHKDVPLVVPEVNPDALINHKGIIANPNCSTIQLVVALKPIYDQFSIERVIASTYQSISGAGQKGMNMLYGGINTFIETGQYDKGGIAFNTLFHEFDSDNLYSVEENKIINETRKILKNPKFQISATCVRLPIVGGHGESVNVQTKKPFNISELREAFINFKGITIVDDPSGNKYPTPLISKGTNDVYIGRLRRDESIENAFNMWVVSDNLRKGAATNAIQIAEYIIENDLIIHQ